MGRAVLFTLDIHPDFFQRGGGGPHTEVIELVSRDIDYGGGQVPTSGPGDLRELSARVWALSGGPAWSMGR